MMLHYVYSHTHTSLRNDENGFQLVSCCFSLLFLLRVPADTLFVSVFLPFENSRVYVCVTQFEI